MEKVINLGHVRTKKAIKEAKEQWMRQKEAIEANPWPTIMELEIELLQLSEYLLIIDKIVNPVEVHLESEFPIQPVDIQNEAVGMVNEVRKVLRGL